MEKTREEEEERYKSVSSRGERESVCVRERERREKRSLQFYPVFFGSSFSSKFEYGYA